MYFSALLFCSCVYCLYVVWVGRRGVYFEILTPVCFLTVQGKAGGALTILGVVFWWEAGVAVNSMGREGGERSLIASRQDGGRHFFHKKKRRTDVSACYVATRVYSHVYRWKPSAGVFCFVVCAILCPMM